jgi:hypothetical protein
VLPDQTGEATVALMGDSHAEHLLIGLAKANPGENIVHYLRAGAPTTVNPKGQDAMQQVLKNKGIRKVVLAWWWRGRSYPWTKSR